MAGLLERLAQNARAYVHDFLDRHWSGTFSIPSQNTESEARDDTARDPSQATDTFTSSSTHAGTGLPYSPELAQCYRTLDLPFGAPMAQVTRRWKAQLKQYHPDLYARDTAKQADATEVTRQLNDAYQKIRTAWTRHQRSR
jgi:DnaJ-domain-containing protein 1